MEFLISKLILNHQDPTFTVLCSVTNECCYLFQLGPESLEKKTTLKEFERNTKCL